ncbi:MAG TPA: hypothetical protein VGA77_07735 [Propylenella sp.]
MLVHFDEAEPLSNPFVSSEHLGRRSWSVDCIALCLERGYRVARKLRGNTILTRDP